MLKERGDLWEIDLFDHDQDLRFAPAQPASGYP
jgi:hypothetical protein